MKKKVEWYDKNLEVFLKVCIDEVDVWNKPHTFFNKIDWANSSKKFKKAKKLIYKKKLKNKWDNLKKELWTKV